MPVKLVCSHGDGEQNITGPENSSKANINKLRRRVSLYVLTTVVVSVVHIIRLEGVSNAILRLRGMNRKLMGKKTNCYDTAAGDNKARRSIQ